MQEQAGVTYKVTYFLEGGDTEHHLIINLFERSDGAIQQRVNIAGLGSTVCQKKGAVGRNWIDSFTTTPTFQPSGTAVKLSCSRVKDV